MSYISLDLFFATLSNPRRVHILQLLDKEGPRSVTQIADDLQIEQSATSHCLKKLLECHFVDVKQEGKERIYSLNTDTMEPLLRQIERHLDRYCAQGCDH